MATSQSDLSQRLSSIASQPTSSRIGAYSEVLHSLLTAPRKDLPAEQLKARLSNYLDAAVFSDANSTGGGLVVGRQALTAFDEALAGPLARNPSEAPDDASQAAWPAVWQSDTRREILEMALEKVTARVLSFEEQTSSLRLHLADLLENDEEWAEAAGVLQGIPLDSGHRSVSDLVKLRILIRIVRLLLESDDSVAADVSLKRASLIVHNVPGAVPALPGTESEVPQTSAEALQEGKQLGLMYKFCQARIYDAQRRFLDAATRFHDLSYVTDIPESEREKMLSAAVTASILSPAGPQRSRILATLMRDERSASLEQHTILSRVFLDQIVRPAEIETFAKLLAPHQRAALPPTSNEAAVASVSAEGDVEMSEGAPPAQLNASTRTGPSTVLDRAMIEHNIIAASRIYSNITIAGLGALLDLSSVGAETMVRRMIAQSRLRAEIDQCDGILTFLDTGGSSVEEAGTAGGLGGSAGDSKGTANGEGATNSAGLSAADEQDDPATIWTRRWDSQIARTATALENVCSRIRNIQKEQSVQA